MLLIVVEAVCLLSPMHTGNTSCKYVLLYILQKLKVWNLFYASSCNEFLVIILDLCFLSFCTSKISKQEDTLFMNNMFHRICNV